MLKGGGMLRVLGEDGRGGKGRGNDARGRGAVMFRVVCGVWRVRCESVRGRGVVCGVRRCVVCVCVCGVCGVVCGRVGWGWERRGGEGRGEEGGG